MPYLTELRLRPELDDLENPVRYDTRLGLLTNLVVLEMPSDLKTCVRSLGNRMTNLRKLQFCFRLEPLVPSPTPFVEKWRHRC